MGPCGLYHQPTSAPRTHRLTFLGHKPPPPRIGKEATCISTVAMEKGPPAPTSFHYLSAPPFSWGPQGPV